jgi:hypothetical protein
VEREVAKQISLLTGFLLLAFPVAHAAAAILPPTPEFGDPEPSPAPVAAAPVTGPLAYTVVGTPPAEQVKLPELRPYRNVWTDTVKVLPDRRIPDVLWFEREGLRYGLVYQKTRAPLVFLIAGTGGSFDSDLNKVLARALYAAGMHVVGLPSPTHPNFIVNASETGVPGKQDDDARDLYRVMRLVYERVQERVDVSDVYLTGYSLGGTYAAWVARLDERERVLGFKKVLLLGPSVSLYNSTRILDAMYDRHVPADPQSAQLAIDRILAALAEAYAREPSTNLDGEFLYRAHAALEPGPDMLETLIGATFRLSSTNLAFTSDVVSGSNYLVSADAELDSATSLTGVFKHAYQQSFNDYIDRLYLPYFQARDPSFTKERAIREAGLLPLEDYLRASPKVGLITSRDDIILAPGEISWLERVFGPRATIFETGGHCGNYKGRDFVDALQHFFRG